MHVSAMELEGRQSVALTERLLRAADAVRFHREFLPCRLVGQDGVLRACELVGAGAQPGTVRVRAWWDSRLAASPVRIEEIALPPGVAERLEFVAAHQV